MPAMSTPDATLATPSIQAFLATKEIAIRSASSHVRASGPDS
jgi:hypothetical protein